MKSASVRGAGPDHRRRVGTHDICGRSQRRAACHACGNRGHGKGWGGCGHLRSFRHSHDDLDGRSDESRSLHHRASRAGEHPHSSTHASRRAFRDCGVGHVVLRLWRQGQRAAGQEAGARQLLHGTGFGCRTSRSLAINRLSSTSPAWAQPIRFTPTSGRARR